LSTPHQVPANGMLYTVVDDCVTVFSAMIVGSVSDEILGRFDSSSLQVKFARNDLRATVSRQGMYAISALPPRSFPKLDTQSYTVDYTLHADGFRDVSLTVNIPASPTLPVPAPATAMRRLPVRLQGRVVQDANGLPVAGALIVCVDNPNPPSPPPPPPLPHTLLMRSPVYSAHAMNAPVQQVNLSTAGTAHLTQPAAAGSRTILLDTTAGLSGSAFVQLANTASTIVEYATVSAIGPQPGLVTLDNPLNRSYAPGAATTVRFVTASPAGSTAHLLLDAGAGDGVLIADTLLQVNTVAIDLGGGAVEYHELGALTGSDGYFAADGIGCAAQIFLRPNPGTPGLPIVPWFIEYDQAVNVVNFRI
jgi:hypothetical protein